MSEQMKISAIAPWYGGKRTLAPTIVGELGAHRAYWEPFCGSMAVLLAKPIASHEHVNDLHCDLINLASVIRDGQLGPQFYRRLRRTLMDEEIYAEGQRKLAEDADAEQIPDLERAYWYFVVSWMGINGIVGTARTKNSFAIRWTPGGGHNSTRYGSAIDSIPAWRRRMRRVTILQRDGFEILSNVADAEGCVIYVDSPYLAKGDRYLHDFDDGDHERLAELLARFQKTRVVVSYYDDPRLDELYPGWTKRDVAITKGLVNQGRRARRAEGEEIVKAPEVLLINGPSYAAKGDGLFTGDTL